MLTAVGILLLGAGILLVYAGVTGQRVKEELVAALGAGAAPVRYGGGGDFGPATGGGGDF